MRYHTLNFGALAAERDIDQGLESYFVESEAFRRVSSGEKTVILGNRGSGKSAIFKVLGRRERQRGSIVLELSPEDFSYDMLAKTLSTESDGAWKKHAAYAAAWKYLIFVMIMKSLNVRGIRFKTGASEKIHNYLRDNHKEEQHNPIAFMISYMKRIDGFKIGPWESGIKAHELARLYKLEEVTPLIPALKELTAKRRVLILVDELDRGWDASEDAQAFVAGLFQACLAINSIFRNVRVYMSLRRELHDSIPTLYDDAQKYRDIIETIAWDENALLELVARRIKYSVPELERCSSRECWAEVFSDFSGARKISSFKYIVDRTLHRPREMLQFCTEALEQSQRRSAWPIDSSSIQIAELKYSSDRAKDISSEFRFQFPGLLSVFEAFRGLPLTLERSDLELACLGICAGDFHVSNEARWVLDQDPEYLIQVLWKSGFLRAQSLGGGLVAGRSGAAFVGQYQTEYLDVRNVGRFQIHPMFRSYLGTKDVRNDAVL